jgi:hypothetical protein
MRNKNNSVRKQLFRRSFKGFSLQELKKRLGKWVAWDNMGLIREHADLQMFAPAHVERIVGQEEVIIWVPSMICGGASHLVSPSELFPCRF